MVTRRFNAYEQQINQVLDSLKLCLMKELYQIACNWDVFVFVEKCHSVYLFVITFFLWYLNISLVYTTVYSERSECWLSHVSGHCLLDVSTGFCRVEICVWRDKSTMSGRGGLENDWQSNFEAIHFEQQQTIDMFWVWTFGFFELSFVLFFGEKVPGKIFLNFTLAFWLQTFISPASALGISAKRLPDMRENLCADFWNKSSGSDLG